MVSDVPTNAVIQGNYIHDFQGAVALDVRQGKGIEVWYQAQGVTIENNTIEDMQIAGIGINDGSDDNTISKNIITGTTGVGGSGGAGILITSFNDTAGAPPTGNTITQNSIYGNAGLGIDLDARTPFSATYVGDGITANDAGDVDAGANGLQNFPVITLVTEGAGTVTIDGLLQTPVSGSYRIEFFASSAAGTNGYFEGERYIGFLDATDGGANDADGLANGLIDFSATLAAVLAADEGITATATVDLGGGNYGSTSEFSGIGILIVDTTADTVDGTVTSIDALIANRGADGRISLREAILATNATTNYGGADHIYFDIPEALVGGAHTIAINSTALGVLPSITDAVVIDGTSEPDFAGTPIIELDGNLLATLSTNHGLTIDVGGGGSTIRGLVINNSGADGIKIELGADGNTIEGNYIGTNVAGNAAAANADDGIEVDSNNNVIRNNLISGNTDVGLLLHGGDGNVVVGNLIGTDAAGLVAISPALQGSARNGITIRNGADSNIIGGTTAAERNIISGNQDDGVFIASDAGAGNVILGNYIGVDITGAAALGNAGQGIAIQGASNTIGGTAAGAGNVISGNAAEGILITGTTAASNLVQGNYIGTDATGMAPLGNALDGVLISAGADTNVIGGTNATYRNVISGNTGNGVRITGVGTLSNDIRWNYIGINANATATLGNAQDGIRIDGSADNVDIYNNTIGGNLGDGIQVDGSGTNSTIIRVNEIGTDSTWTQDFGNAGHGIYVSNGPLDTRIGNNAIASSTANTVYNNDGDGIRIEGASTTTNYIQINRTYNNGGLGINLVGGTEDAFGVTQNDNLDADTGANNLQNYPVITSATTNGTNVTVNWTLNTAASQTNRYAIFFYVSQVADASGNGEGQRYIGMVPTVSTNASGNASGAITFVPGINNDLSMGVSAGWVVTANVWDRTTNDASEYGVAVTLVGTTTPVNTVPGAQTVNQDTPLAFTGGNTISVNDADGDLSTVQLTVTSGTLNVTLQGAASISAGANGSATFTLSGDQADINATLATLIYQGNLGYSGADTLTVLSTDDTARTDSDNVAITVTGVSAYSISGTIYEDVNGDSSLADAVGASGVTVRLFSDDGDNTPDAGDTFITSTLTDGLGDYTFSGLSDLTTYWVVVDSRTITPSAGVSAANTAWAEQTYAVTGAVTSSGTLATSGALYGGRSAATSDNSTDAAASLATSDHITRVAVSGGDAADIDSAFSFNVVTNIRGDGADDDGGAARLQQGSLHQFIINANTITGDNDMLFVPAIDPNVDGGDGLGGGNDYWQITILRELAQITGAGTTIDGTAYGYTEGVVGISVRDDNAGTLGYTGAVGLGADGIAGTGDDPAPLTGTERPELEIVAGPHVGVDTVDGNADDVYVGLDIQVGDVTVRRIAIHGFGDDNTQNAVLAAEGDIRIGTATGTFTGSTFDASQILIEDNFIGFSPVTLTLLDDPGAGNRSVNGIVVAGPDGGTIQNNVVAFSGRFGTFFTASTDGWTVEGNDYRWTALENGSQDSIDIGNGSGNMTIRRNYFYQSEGAGVDSWQGDGLNLIENNTFDANGQGGTELSQMRLFGDDSIVRYNLIQNSPGDGILLVTDVQWASAPYDGPTLGNTITRNSFVNITAAAIDLNAANGGVIGSPWANNDVGDGATLNDGALLATSANYGMDYPVFDAATLAGTTLTVSGYIGTAAGDTDFANAQIEIYKSDASGAGEIYLGSLVADASGNFSGSIDVSGTGLVTTDTVSGTATDNATNSTSEFGQSYAVTGNTSPVGNDDTYTTSEDTSLSTPGGWWDGDWGYRSTVALDNPTGSALTDFPVRIRLDASFDYAKANADGSDLRFVDADGVTVLAYEIESWNVGGESYIWVKVPNVASGGDSITMYYGNDAAAAPPSTAVWSNGYRAVYHFGSDPGAVPGGVVDSTGNGLDGDNVGATYTNVAPPTNVNGGALDFLLADSDYVNLGPGNYINGAASATFTAWINPDALSGSQHIVGVSTGTSTGSSRAAIELFGDEIRVIAKPLDASGGVTVTTTSANLVAGQWYRRRGRHQLHHWQHHGLRQRRQRGGRLYADVHRVGLELGRRQHRLPLGDPRRKRDSLRHPIRWPDGRRHHLTGRALGR